MIKGAERRTGGPESGRYNKDIYCVRAVAEVFSSLLNLLWLSDCKLYSETFVQLLILMMAPATWLKVC